MKYVYVGNLGELGNLPQVKVWRRGGSVKDSLQACEAKAQQSD